MRVEIAELRRAASRLFDHLDKAGIRSFDIEHDHYWVVPRESRYNVYEQPQQLDVGQLTDDLQSLRSVNNSAEPVVAYGLVWLAAILREIGEREVG